MSQYPTNLTDKQWQVTENILDPQHRKRKYSQRHYGCYHVHSQNGMPMAYASEGLSSLQHRGGILHWYTFLLHWRVGRYFCHLWQICRTENIITSIELQDIQDWDNVSLESGWPGLALHWLIGLVLSYSVKSAFVSCLFLSDTVADVGRDKKGQNSGRLHGDGDSNLDW